jgi:transcription factor WhiB
MSTVVEIPRIVRPAPSRGPVLPKRPSWQDRAACNESFDPVFFGPEDGDHWTVQAGSGTPTTEDERAAQAAAKYCDRCPVWSMCLTSALRTGSRGVWAGTTWLTRTALARTRVRKGCPNCRGEILVSIERHDVCLACGASWKTPHRQTDAEQETTDGDDGR